MTGWTYVPEFTRDGDTIKRGAAPMYRHASGTCIDIVNTSCLTADMLDVEGKHDQAVDVRLMCAGDVPAFCRVFNTTLPQLCACGSGMGPWWQRLKNGTRLRVCDRCMRQEGDGA